MDKRDGGHIWKLVLSYDGTEFHGWQVQPERTSVQGELRAAIRRVTGEDVLPQGSGRTDAGVHALAQVASFWLTAPIPPASLVRALNRTLPAAVRVLNAVHADDSFHARHSAQQKSYEYRVYRGEVCPPWLARYVYAFPQPLNVAAMQRAAERVVGEHDFTSFAANDPDEGSRGKDLRPSAGKAAGSACAGGEKPESDGGNQGSSGERNNRRIIYTSKWSGEWSGWESGSTGGPSRGQASDSPRTELLLYRVRGSGFLHHMVRNLVGTFLEVGRGRLEEGDVAKILAARSRASAGPTAPAKGLFLVEVQYGKVRYDEESDLPRVPSGE